MFILYQIAAPLWRTKWFITMATRSKRRYIRSDMFIFWDKLNCAKVFAQYKKNLFHYLEQNAITREGSRNVHDSDSILQVSHCNLFELLFWSITFQEAIRLILKELMLHRTKLFWLPIFANYVKYNAETGFGNAVQLMNTRLFCKIECSGMCFSYWTQSKKRKFYVFHIYSDLMCPTGTFRGIKTLTAFNKRLLLFWHSLERIWHATKFAIQNNYTSCSSLKFWNVYVFHLA